MSSHGIPAAAPTRRLEGKVAVITGGASGIGEATVRLFIQHGAKVVVADVQDELGLSLCTDIGCGEESITYVHCDVTSDSDVQKAVDTAVSRYGKLDIMYNNAGITGEAELDIIKTNNDDFRRVFDVNVFGAFLGAKHAARVMIPAADVKGCILFTASASSILGGDLPHGYVASKHALVGLVKNLSVELGQYGIRVNAISPFGIATPLLRGFLGGMGKDEVERVVSMAANLKGVNLKATDIADAALYLASDDARYVSGMNLVVDGGYTKTNVSLGYALKNLAAASDGSSIMDQH